MYDEKLWDPLCYDIAFKKFCYLVLFYNRPCQYCGVAAVARQLWRGPGHGGRGLTMGKRRRALLGRVEAHTVGRTVEDLPPAGLRRVGGQSGHAC